MTVILSRFFKNSSILWEINKRLSGPSHKEIHVGRVVATLDTGKFSSQQNLYVVKNLDEPLLGGPLIKTLKLLGKVDAINDESHQYKKSLREYSKALENRKTYLKYK